MTEMNKKIVLAGGCFWGEDSLGDCPQDLASYFASEASKVATRCTAPVRRGGSPIVITYV